LEEEMNRVAASMTISGEVTKGRAFAKKWAGAHPIRYSIADRETTLSRAVERDSSGSLSTGVAVTDPPSVVIGRPPQRPFPLPAHPARLIISPLAGA
jgi:hypothetical protein